MHIGGSGDLSLFVWCSVNVQGLEGRYQSQGKDESVDEGGVNEISSSSAIDEGGGYNSSCSVL